MAETFNTGGQGRAGTPSLELLREVSSAAARLATRHPRWLGRATRPPSLACLARVPSTNAPLARAVMRQLRSRLLLHSALMEGEGESPLVTAARWSAFGDEALKLADRVAMHEVSARFGQPITADGKPVGRAIFGLGKLGAEELNPSSDIDVLFAYATDAGHVSGSDLSLHELFSRWAKAVRSLLADVDDEGFVFRVDLDLRPEGARGALVNSLDAIEAYYERFGQTWEKAALLRLRPIVDEQRVGARLVRRLRPFIFPRHPDPRLLESLADMRARIATTAQRPGFDVKREEGGIRDVEFRVQALQLLHGGRLPALRTGSTVALLGQLRALGLLPHKTALQLEDGYVLLRRVEHALQYKEDRQTQWLPPDGEERERVGRVIARAAGYRGVQGFEQALARARTEVRAAYDDLFHELGRRVHPEALLALDRTASDEQRLEALARLGFADAASGLGTLEQLAGMRGSPFAPAVQARDARARVLAARLLDEAARSPHPSRALSRLPDLLRTLGRDGERWPLFLDDERLSGLLIRVLAASPLLSRLLTRGAAPLEVLAVGPRRRRRSRVRLAEAMENPDDDEEEALNRIRRVKARETLGIGLGFLDGRLDLVTAGHRLSTVADAAVQQALFIALARVEGRFGKLKGAEVSVLALGRLGGRELGFLSDLDLLFVWDGEGETDGRRAIDAREWAGRVAQQCVWALTAPLVQGACYDVDTRLRPSGSKGPLCVRLGQLERYHAQESELWERQALLKLRPIAGSRALGHRAVGVARTAVSRPAPPDLGTRLLDMRQRMIEERTRGGPGFDLKMSDGGVADVEFAVQGLQLRWASEAGLIWAPSTRRAMKHLEARGHLRAREATALRAGYELLSRAREGLLLVSDGQEAVLEHGDPRLQMLARMGGLELPGENGDELYEACIDAAVRVREAASRVLVTL